MNRRSVSRCAGLALGLLAGCGARSGLGLPDEARDAGPFFDVGPSLDAGRLDAGLDGGPPDAPFDTGVDAPIDACVPVSVALEPILPEVLFVLDRSTSMGWSLTGPMGPGPSRWSILLDALRTELPSYDASSNAGLLLYPDTGGGVCSVAPAPQLDPSPRNAMTILRTVGAASPGGRTPTADALEAARRFFEATPASGRPRAIVLATDGAPNCNGALDSRTCLCTGGAGLMAGTCRGEPELCLDEARARGVLDTLLAEEIPTYVIGIDGDPDPTLSAVLTRMALAGGRPNPLDPMRAYYSVRRPEDLAAAFDRIQGSIVSCTLALSGPIPPGRALEVTIDGAIVPRDPSRTEGWDLGASLEGTVELFGDACARAAASGVSVSLDVRCDPA